MHEKADPRRPPVRWMLFLAIVIAGATGSQAGEPPVPEPFEYEGVWKDFALGIPSAARMREHMKGLERALARRSDLARDAAARGRVSFSATAQAKLEGWLGLGAAVGFGHSGGTIAVGHRLLKFKGAADPSDRSATAQIEVVVGFTPDGLLVKRAWSVKLEYADNETYLRALGLDSRNVPGMRTALALMERVTGRATAPPPAPSTPLPPGLAAPAHAALREVVPDMFQAATRIHRVTLASGTVVENATGTLSISHMQHEQLDRSQRPGEGRVWSEVSLGVDVDATLGATPLGTAVGGLALELKRTYGNPPPQDPAPGASAAELWSRGDLPGLVEQAQGRLASVLDPESSERALDALLQRGEAVPSGSDRVVAVPDADIGGVRIQYDPGLLGARVAPARAAILLRRVSTALGEGQTGFVVGGDDGKERLEVVSLAALLGDGSTRVGSITRLRGCVLAEEDVLLLGVAEPGVPVLDLDTLTVAMRNTWEAGAYPFVSLDPETDDLGGPQRTRVGGVLESLRESGFVRVMLDADHAMKRISLGAVDPGVAGFRRLVDLLREAPPASLLSRAWIVPMRSGAADVWTLRRGPREAVLFDTRVQVLSESMRRTQEGLVGGGEVDPLAARAADEMTCHYDALARRIPVLGQLRGLFSAVKLAAILRMRAVDRPVLRRLAARSVTRVEIPSRYEGVRLDAGRVRMAGGAVARVRLSKGSFREASELEPLLAARPGATVETTLPASVGLSATEAAYAEGELQLHRGLSLYQEGDYGACERQMDAALARDDELALARRVRALCRLARGGWSAALEDIEALRPHTPEVIAVRALVHTLRGDDEQARRDLEAAAGLFPEDDDVAALRAQAHLYRFELAEAERIAIALQARTPTDPVGRALLEVLRLLHQVGPTEARRRIGHLRHIPPMTVEAFSDGLQSLMRLDAPAAQAGFARCLRLLEGSPADPHAEAIHLRERCELGQVLATSAAERLARTGLTPRPAGPSASQAAQALVARRPQWPSAHLLAASAAAEGDLAGMERHLEAAASLPREGDPLLADLSALLGSERADAAMALACFHQAAVKDLPDAVVERLLRRAVKALGGSPEATLLGLVSEATSIGRMTAVARLRDGLLATPTPLPSDPVAVQAIGFCHAWYANVTEREASERERRIVVARWFLRATDVDDLPWSAWVQTGMQRLQAFGILVDAARNARALDPELRRLRLAFANRRAPLAELREQFSRWDARHRAAAVESMGSFFSAWRDAFQHDGFERELWQHAAEAVEDVPEGSERAAYVQALQSWRDDLLDDLHPSEWVGSGAAEEDAAGIRTRATQRLFARLDAVVAQARRPADVRLLAWLTDSIATSLGTLAGRAPEAAQDMEALLERLVAGMPGALPAPGPRDWARWSDPGGH